jgi:CubicO group peptidase (beta-lactamase class C family)
MTAAMIARLVERGVLAWDRPLERMLPDYVSTMHPSYRDVTLVELLSHRSGLPSNAKVDFWDRLYDDPTPRSAQRLKYIREGLRAEPAAQKRAAVSYSNDAFVVAAVCAERATGRTYEDLMTAELFAPLKIRSASFDQFGGPGEPSGHTEGRQGNRPNDPNPRMFAPAGGIRMNLPDWARFCIDQLQGRQGRGRILRTETYRFLQAPQGDTVAALGWGALTDIFGRRGPVLFHSGSDGKWTALVTLFQETGNGVLVATNAFESMRGDRAAGEALRALVATVAAPK